MPALPEGFRDGYGMFNQPKKLQQKNTGTCKQKNINTHPLPKDFAIM